MQTDERILEIFRKLERTLNTSLSKVIRERLIEGGDIKEHLDYLDGHVEMVTWEELRNKAAEELRWEKKYYRQWLEEPLPETRRYSSVRVPQANTLSGLAVPSWVTARADANSEYAAGVAEKYPGVWQFREHVLGDNWPLTKGQAGSFLASPAAAFFPFEWFEEWNIPFIKHYAEVKGEYHMQEFGRDIDHRASVYIVPLYSVKRVRYAHEGTPLPAAEEIDAQNIVLYTSLGADSGKKVEPPHRKDMPHPGTDRVTYPWIWPGSILDSLRRFGEDVAKEQHWWDAGDAIWFILTGEAPFLPPIVDNVRFSPGAKLRGVEESPIPESDIPIFEEQRIVEENRPSNANITLTVEPWVPADLVKNIYRARQLQLVGREKPSWERNLKVYRFVKEKQKKGIDPSTLHNLWALPNSR